jgi:hypothetical protein
MATTLALSGNGSKWRPLGREATLYNRDPALQRAAGPRGLSGANFGDPTVWPLTDRYRSTGQFCAMLSFSSTGGWLPSGRNVRTGRVIAMPYGWTQPVPHIQPYHLRTATFSFLPEPRASHSAGGGGLRGASAGCLMSAVRGGGGDGEALLSFTLVGRRRISPSPIRPPASGGWPSLALLTWE